MNRHSEPPPPPLGSEAAYQHRLNQLQALARKHGDEAALTAALDTLRVSVFWLEANYGARPFVDPSGGSADSMTLAIGHVDHGKQSVIVDCLREVTPPFSPEAVVEEFSKLLASYGLDHVTGDRYAGLWPVEQFSRFGIRFEQAAQPKSDLYRDLLPLINSGRIELLDQPKLIAQLTNLERRTSRGGRDSIDHPPGGHDDLSNAVGGLASINNKFAWDTAFAFVDGNDADDPHGIQTWRRARYAAYLRAQGIPL
jgi:hypothetical protein